jgi:RND family efflux transporter MFP subunit
MADETIEAQESRPAPRWSTGLPALVMLVIAASVAACTGERGSREPAVDLPPLSVTVEALAPVSWDAGLEVTAGVEPYRRATPGTILMGRITKIVRREGDRVRSGELLALVESRDVAARLAQAEAALGGARSAEENARALRGRMERLYPKDAASKRSLDDAVAAHEGALAALDAAREGVAAARIQESYAEVRAPFDGVITQRHVEAGDMAAPGVPFFVIEEVTRLKIEASVPESRATGLRAGRPVAVRVDALGEHPRAGTLEEILPSADPRSRTFTVRVVLANPDGDLKPGMFARLRLESATGREVIAVPERALHRRGPLTGIYIVDDTGHARLRWITVGETRDGLTEVLTGLEEGARIITDAPGGLGDGRRVEPAR